jgi:4-amino-4-deoxy-L-arabinose transferase-like glycosyltransferase
MSDLVADASGLAVRSPARARLTVWLLTGAAAVAITALYVFGSASYPLAEPDEPRYAEIGREMLESGDWVTPRLNYVKYFEKPPLVYWATTASFVAFGVNEFAARLPVLLSALVTLLVTVLLAVRMFGSTTALLALPILALSPLFGFLAQVLTLDMSLACFTTAALAAVWQGWSTASPRGRRVWYRIAYAATACAILVKGPVAAVLVAGVALPFLLLAGGWPALRPALDWRGMLLAAAITLPWFVLVSWRNPEFVHFFVVDQHVARYLWTNEHGEPIWFYLPLIAPALGPWGIAFLLDPKLLGAAWPPRAWSPPVRFLAVWAAVIITFFSLSASKLVTYLLPTLPPLAILAARGWQHAIAARRTAGLARLGWVLLIGGPIMSACGAVLPLIIDHWRMPLIAPTLLAGGPVLLATGWLMRRALSQGRSFAAYATLTVGWFGLFAVAITGRVAVNEYRDLALAARAALRPDDRLAIYDSYVQGIPFYTGRRAIMVIGAGELTFGSKQGDQSAYFWSSLDRLRREWAAPGRLFLVIKRSDLRDFDPPLDPAPQLVAEKHKKVLVVNR